MSDKQKVELRRLAEAATQGEWKPSGSESHGTSVVGRADIAWCGVNGRYGSEGSYSISAKEAKANAKFIAAANPVAVLSLLDENEALLKQVAALQSDENSWQSGYDKGRDMGAKHRSAEAEQLGAKVEALRGLLVQCALSAATLRADAPHYANHSGFNESFTDAIRKASGVKIGHGFASTKYPSQEDAVAAIANEGIAK